MATLTVRLPDDKHNRLRIMAKQRGVSLNRLMDELATTALTEFDTSTRFKIRASHGSRKKGLRLLDKLDSAES
jgi:plasmid stability protein